MRGGYALYLKYLKKDHAEKITSFLESRNTKTESNYLLNSVSIYETIEANHTNRCDIRECKSVLRIGDILKKYHKIHHNNYNNTKLLNDYNHLLLKHSSQFEDIHNIFVQEYLQNQLCDISKCLMLQRNHRDRMKFDAVQYFEDDTDIEYNNIIRQQIIDRIHSFYLHSFDIGYKLTKHEKDYILNLNDDIKHAENEDIDRTTVRDAYVSRINRLIKSKQSLYANVTGLRRLVSVNNKFISKSYNKSNGHHGQQQQTAQNRNMNENNNTNIPNMNNPSNGPQPSYDQYSFGVRYFYWSHYKNNKAYHDDAHWSSDLKCMSRPAINGESTLGHWYISAKYDNLKEELLSNKICTIPSKQYKCLINKAAIHIDTDFVRTIYCPRTDSAKYYDITSKCFWSRITKSHLIALMIYCNYDVLQYKFSETYRYLTATETDDALKKGHSEYYFLGKLLRECVECFGMACSDKTGKHMTLFHGVSGQLMFSSIFACIKGPLSTTKDYAVAVGFCGNEGIIVDMNMYIDEWRFKFDEGKYAKDRIACFDCQWISDYPNESEILFIGGLGHFTFNTIIEPSGADYLIYMNGIKQATYNCFVDSAWGDSLNIPSSKSTTNIENQMVFRLLSHELNKYFPNHRHSHSFDACPAYINDILHNHCASIKEMKFLNRNKENLIQDKLLKYENEWIQLDVLAKLFPNIKKIAYDASKKDIPFLKDVVICSILSFLKHNKQHQLQKISIWLDIDANLLDEFTRYINKFKQKFTEYLWTIDLVIVNHWRQGLTSSINDHEEEKIELLFVPKSMQKSTILHAETLNYLESTLYAMIINVILYLQCFGYINGITMGRISVNMFLIICCIGGVVFIFNLFTGLFVTAAANYAESIHFILFKETKCKRVSIRRTTTNLTALIVCVFASRFYGDFMACLLLCIIVIYLIKIHNHTKTSHAAAEGPKSIATVRAGNSTFISYLETYLWKFLVAHIFSSLMRCIFGCVGRINAQLAMYLEAVWKLIFIKLCIPSSQLKTISQKIGGPRCGRKLSQWFKKCVSTIVTMFLLCLLLWMVYLKVFTELNSHIGENKLFVSKFIETLTGLIDFDDNWLVAGDLDDLITQNVPYMYSTHHGIMWMWQGNGLIQVRGRVVRFLIVKIIYI